METTPLEKPGLTVTRIGLGLTALGRPGYINLGHADDLGRDREVAAMEAKPMSFSTRPRREASATSMPLVLWWGGRILVRWLTCRALRPGP